jgi:hypothetical protein
MRRGDRYKTPKLCGGGTDNSQQQQKKRWACPFFKLDPVKYMDCSRFQLARVKDVKQHIDRKHSRLQLFCPVCHVNTSPNIKDNGDDEDFGIHLCGSKWEMLSKGMTSSEREALFQRSDSNLLDRDQWYRVWAVFFPDQPPPNSPHVGSLVEEAVATVRILLAKNGEQAITSVRKDTEGRLRNLLQWM